MNIVRMIKAWSSLLNKFLFQNIMSNGYRNSILVSESYAIVISPAKGIILPDNIIYKLNAIIKTPSMKNVTSGIIACNSIVMISNVRSISIVIFYWYSTYQGIRRLSVIIYNNIIPKHHISTNRQNQCFSTTRTRAYI